MNLRTRILKDGIHCLPWRMLRGEIEELPISSQTLFRRSGIPIDILERELKHDGFLMQNEELLEVLKNAENLKRRRFGSDEEVDEWSGVGDFPDDWTDEDYMGFYEGIGQKK
jgi:hypothetical protein